jgi:hypothetical protein
MGGRDSTDPALIVLVVTARSTNMNRPTLADCCATTPSAMCFWTAVFGLSYGAAVLLRTVWPSANQYRDTATLTALAVACIANFSRNRTLHCALTGPLFLAGAIVALLGEAGIWHVESSLLWAVVLIGVIVSFLVEWRTPRRQVHPTNASGPKCA